MQNNLKWQAEWQYASQHKNTVNYSLLFCTSVLNYTSVLQFGVSKNTLWGFIGYIVFNITCLEKKNRDVHATPIFFCQLQNNSFVCCNWLKGVAVFITKFQDRVRRPLRSKKVLNCRTPHSVSAYYQGLNSWPHFCANRYRSSL